MSIVESITNRLLNMTINSQVKKLKKTNPNITIEDVYQTINKDNLQTIMLQGNYTEAEIKEIIRKAIEGDKAKCKG